MSRITTIDEAAAARGPDGRDRREEAFLRARRHSRRVRFLKIALPAAAVVVAAAFVGATRQIDSATDISVGMSGITVSDGKLVMANPTLEGVNADNLPYRMTADRAVQEGAATGPIRLEGVDARLPFDANNFAEVNADSAVYDRSSNVIDFDSVVNVTTTDGMKARLTTARLDMEKGVLTTQDAVAIQLDGADIEANSMTVRDNGKVLVFKDRVRMQIMPGRLRPADGTGGTDGD